MLISHSTLLTRARRRKEAIPTCTITSPGVLQGVVQAVAAAERSAVLSIDMTRLTTFESSLLVGLAALAAKQAPGTFSVHALVAPKQESVRLAFESGASSVSLARGSEHARKFLTEFTAWTVKMAMGYDGEVMGALNGLVIPHKLEEFMQVTGVQSLSIPVAVEQRGKLQVSLPYIQQIAKLAKVPLVAQDAALPLQMRRKCAQVGIASFMLGPELEEAYTAGIRTGLRNRAAVEPHRYEQVGVKAVHSAVQHYLSAL